MSMEDYRILEDMQASIQSAIRELQHTLQEFWEIQDNNIYAQLVVDIYQCAITLRLLVRVQERLTQEIEKIEDDR